jgi:iron complex transport system permease protein
MTGDETATSLGVDVSRFRIEMLIATSLLTGAVVAVSGGIGFVGMVVPHVCRLVVGADHRRLIPVATLGGAIFLVLVDIVARTAAAPQELPIGIVTAAIGAPFFLWLLRRRPVGGVR